MNFNLMYVVPATQLSIQQMAVIYMRDTEQKH